MLGCFAVSVLSTLPEQTLVVAKEWGTFHLTLMAQNGVSLLAQLLRAHWHTHLDVGNVPFGPSSAVHPNSTILKPLGTSLLLLVDSCQYGIGTLAVCAMRVGQVGSHVNLVWLNLANELLDGDDIVLGHRQLLNLSALVEGQVEEVDMLAVDAAIFAGQSGFATTDKSLKAQNLLCIKIAFFLVLNKCLNHLIAVLDNLIATIGKDGVETIDEVHESANLLIAHSDIT